MFSSEPGAWQILDPALKRYLDKFGVEFPIYDHINKTSFNDFDFSIIGCTKTAEWIDELIATNKPVEIPADYNDRFY